MKCKFAYSANGETVAAKNGGDRFRTVYLAFNGAETSYWGELLRIDDVTVEASGLSRGRINGIAAALKRHFAGRNVVFVTKPPKSGEFSTVFIGRTSAFARLGHFLGLAETIGGRNGNAFVMLDASAGNDLIIETIAHEVGHLLGESHPGEGISAYAATYIVSSGVISNGLIIETGDLVYVRNGGSAVDTTVSSGGTAYISAGGAAVSSLLSGGWQVISSGGTDTGTTVFAGGTNYATNYATVSDTVISSGGEMWMYANAVAYNPIISDGGKLSANATISNAVVKSGGYVWLDQFGVAQNYNMIIEDGGSSWNWGGKDFDTLIQGGGTQTVSGSVNGSAIRTIVSGAEAVQSVAAAGSSLDVQVMDGGMQQVGGNGKTFRTSVLADGSQVVLNGGSAFNAEIAGNNAVQTVSYGGVASANLVSSGGTQWLLGSANFTTLGNGGSMVLLGTAGQMGMATNAQVEEGGHLQLGISADAGVSSGGSANFVNISSGGTVTVSSAGRVTNVTQSGGGLINVDVIGEDNRTIASGTNLSGNFRLLNGVASNFYLDGSMTVFSGGVASKTYLTSMGSQTVLENGLASDTAVDGGIQTVSAGGTAFSTEIAQNGVQNLYGYASNTVIGAGSQNVYSGGSARATTLSAGGVLYVESGGIVTGAAGELYAGTIRVGGTLELLGAVTGADSATLTFLVNERTTADTAMVVNLDNLGTAAGYTVNVSSNQEGGTYRLATGAAAFSAAVNFTIDGLSIGTIGLDVPLEYGGRTYTLTLSDGNLNLSIQVDEPPSLTVTIDDGELVDSSDGLYSLREVVELYAPLKLVNGTAYVTFAMNAGQSNVVTLTGGLNLKVNTSIDGGGVISVTGGVIYGNAKEMTLKDITLGNDIVGGVLNGETAGDTVLTIDNVTVSSTALIMAGSMISDGNYYRHTGNISLTLDGIQLRGSNRVYAAGSVSNGGYLRINGDVSLHIVDIDVDTSARRIYAGGQVQGNSEMRINGNIVLTVDASSSVPYLFAGGAVLDAGSTLTINGTVTTTINSGNFLGIVGNGSQSLGTTSQKSSTLTINGGTFANLVYAGAYSQGGVVSVSGDSTMVINGGTFNSYVIGGCGASAYNNANGNNTIVSGNTSITVNAAGDIYFNGNIYCGSAGNGVITGNTAITFTGSGANLHFADSIRVIGDSCTAGPKKNYISGDRYVTFDGFTGDFGASLLGFDVFTVTGNSSVTYKGSSATGLLEDVSIWKITVNSSNATAGALIWDTADSNNFAGDTFELSFASSLGSALVYDGNSAGSIAGWGASMTVKFIIDDTSYNCSWNAARNGWIATAAGSTWLLSADTVNNDLKLSKLA